MLQPTIVYNSAYAPAGESTAGATSRFLTFAFTVFILHTMSWHTKFFHLLKWLNGLAYKTSIAVMNNHVCVVCKEPCVAFTVVF